MQRNAFGQIVASLRKERRNPLTGRPWTQEQLAAASSLSLRVIANLEQGKKATLDGVMLENLASALQLTTLERREFFTLAIDLEDGSATAPVFDVAAADAELLELFAGLHQPAFLYDDYFDILAANHAALMLHAIEPLWLQNLAGEGERPNFLHVIFAPDSPMRRSMQAGWRMLALRNLHQFRAMTLRHRHTTRWHDLMAQLGCKRVGSGQGKESLPGSLMTSWQVIFVCSIGDQHAYGSVWAGDGISRFLRPYARYPGSPDFRVHQVGDGGGFTVINTVGSAPVRQRR